MDDGDLGDSIDHHAQIVEDKLPSSRSFFNDEVHRMSSRWWFASSAFPMIAGTLGPVASAFSICALVRPWRQHYLPGSNVQEATYVRDPIWLTTINAIQLAVAVVSNLFLLLNMARRVRFSIAQPVTIIGWYISSLCLIVLLATVPGESRENLSPNSAERTIWSQAFYYGIWSAILYFICASLMTVTFSGAILGHYDKDFALTHSQRTLMLQTIMFLMYLLLGALIFSSTENWSYLDAVYWADVTLFTVGFGDYAVSSNLGRALLFPYALVGIISIALVIGSIRSLMLDRGSRQMNARIEEKKRRKTVRTMTIRGRDTLLEPIRQDSDLQGLSNMPSNEFERRKAEFELMRKIQDAAAIRRRWVAMGISTGTWFILWFVGAYVFLETEKPYQPTWNYYVSVYFCFVSFTTIGYGDETPVSNAGKAFFVFWSLLALPTMTVLISNAGDTVVKLIRDATLRLGNITILPDEVGVLENVKQTIHVLSCGRLFSRHVEDQRRNQRENHSIHQQIIGHRQPRSKPEATAREDANNLESQGIKPSNLDRSRQTREDPESSSSSVNSYFRNLTHDLPEGAELHYILITEIQEISEHLRHKNPRKYTFEEWAWYLKLMGEDESNPETHRKARAAAKKRRLRKNKSEKALEEEMEEEAEAQWSWVGHRSPLVGHTEESEWIMDRLTESLKQSLEHERRRSRRSAHHHGKAKAHKESEMGEGNRSHGNN